MRHATLRPDLPSHLLPPPNQQQANDEIEPQRHSSVEKPNTSKRLIDRNSATEKRRHSRDEFGDDDVPDFDLIKAAAVNCDFVHIDDLSRQQQYSKHTAQSAGSKRRKTNQGSRVEQTEEPPAVRLENGRWPCKHRCKDKTACKHLCCRDGLDAPPKVSKHGTAMKSALPQHDHRQFGKQQSVEKSFAKQEANLRFMVSDSARDAIEDIDLTESTHVKRSHHLPEQPSKIDEQVEHTNFDFDPWTTIEDDHDVFEELNELPSDPQPAPKCQSPLPSPSGLDLETETEIVLLQNAQSKPPAQPAAGSMPDKSNTLFCNNSSGSNGGSALRSPEFATCEHETFNLSPTKEADSLREDVQAPSVKQAPDPEFDSRESGVERDAPDELAGRANKENERAQPSLEGVEKWLLEEFGDIVKVV